MLLRHNGPMALPSPTPWDLRLHTRYEMIVGKTKETLHFSDETGRRWTAFEVGNDSDRCLVFDTSDTFRRVRHYPDNWRELTAGELLALSWKR